MREIKFKAWDINENCWKIFNIASMFEAEKMFNYKYRNFINWRQFTGLKDKNGKEIYEGDIIIKQMSDKPYSERKKYENVVMIVEWYKGTNDSTADMEFNKRNLDKDQSCYNEKPCFRGKRIKGEFCCHSWSEFARCEVIGNIFENPNLLTK